MNVSKTIQSRRAFRSLNPTSINKELIIDLASHAQLAPSCFNNQPWQFIFVFEPIQLNQMFDALSSGNDWAKEASMIIVVHSKESDDCIIHDRKYFQFDSGLATAFLILRATELGLVAHPIAGYSPKKTRMILGIPDNHAVITLVIVGKHANFIRPILSDKQRKDEKIRPIRKSISEFVSYNRFGNYD
jgi:nitroreductase